MSLDKILLWGPNIIFTIAFVWMSYFGLRRQSVPRRFSVLLFAIYFGERIVEYAIRVIATLNNIHSNTTKSFGSDLLKTQFWPSLQNLLFKQMTIILIAAGVCFLLALYAKKTQEEKLDMSDVVVLTFGILVSGWPNFLIYFALVFVCTTIGLLVSKLFAPHQSMVITPYFAIAGIVIIYFGWTLSRFVGLYALR